MDHHSLLLGSMGSSSMDPSIYTSTESNPSMYSQLYQVPQRAPMNRSYTREQRTVSSHLKDMHLVKSTLQEVQSNISEMNKLMKHPPIPNGITSPAVQKDINLSSLRADQAKLNEILNLLNQVALDVEDNQICPDQCLPTHENDNNNISTPSSLSIQQALPPTTTDSSKVTQQFPDSNPFSKMDDTQTIESSKLEAEEKSVRKRRTTKRKGKKKRDSSAHSTDHSAPDSCGISRHQIEELRQEEAELPGLDDSGLSKEIDSLSLTIQQLVKENKQFQSCFGNVSTNQPLHSYGVIPPNLPSSDSAATDSNLQLILQEQERLHKVEQKMEVLAKNTLEVDQKLSGEIMGRDEENSKLGDEINFVKEKNLELTQDLNEIQKQIRNSDIHMSCQIHIEELMKQKLLLQKQLDLFLEVDTLDKNANEKAIESNNEIIADGNDSPSKKIMEKQIVQLKMENQSLNEKLDALVLALKDMSSSFKSTRDEFEKLRLQKTQLNSSHRDGDITRQLQKQIHDLQLDVQNAYKELHKETLEKDKVVNEKEKIQHILSSELCSANEEIQELKYNLRKLQEENKLLLCQKANSDDLSDVVQQMTKYELTSEQEKLVQLAIQPIQKELGEERLKSKLINAAHQETVQFVDVLQETVRESQEKNLTLQNKYDKLRKFLGIKKGNHSSSQDLRDFNDKIENITKTNIVIDENYKNMLSTLGRNIAIAVEILSSHLFSSSQDIHPCPELSEDPSFWFAAQCSRLRWLQCELRRLCVDKWKKSSIEETTDGALEPPCHMPLLVDTEIELPDQQTKLTQIRDHQIEHLKHQFDSPNKSDSSTFDDSESFGESYVCD